MGIDNYDKTSKARNVTHENPLSLTLNLTLSLYVKEFIVFGNSFICCCSTFAIVKSSTRFHDFSAVL